MKYSDNARARMRTRNISEAEVADCLDNPSNSYLAGVNAVYVHKQSDGRLLKVKVRGGANPLILHVFRVGET